MNADERRWGRGNSSSASICVHLRLIHSWASLRGWLCASASLRSHFQPSPARIGGTNMDFFNYKNGELYCENVPAERIAQEVGTAVYIYSKATLLHHYRQIRDAFAPLNPTICYSIKSNGNINLCKVLAQEGCGFDVTSGGELFRALQAGGDPKKMIYAGVGKTDQEIADGINAGISAFNLESEEEIENVDRVAASLEKVAIGALRVHP